MKLPYIRIIISSAFILALASCEKAEQPIKLPPAGNGKPGTVAMGKDYETMVYYDFEHNTVVKSSALASWDLSFEAGATGQYIFMNGGKKVTVINTHQHSFADVKALPPGTHPDDWQHDSPDGRPDKTAIGGWADGNNSHGDIYIIQTGAAGDYRKIKFCSVNAQEYVIQYGDLSAQNGSTLTIPKAADYNAVYFSFDAGIVSVEPPKAAWDVVFTDYDELVFDYDPAINRLVPYTVCGVLLNPYKTSASADSTDGFSTIDLDRARALPATTARNVIGYDWKYLPNGVTGAYSVNPSKAYVLHTRDAHLIKLHFLDFYSSTGVKGNPKFESVIME